MDSDQTHPPSCKLHPTTATVGHPTTVHLFVFCFFFSSLRQSTMSILRKSLWRLSSLDGGITERKPDKKGMKISHRGVRKQNIPQGIYTKTRVGRRGLLSSLQSGCVITALSRLRLQSSLELSLRPRPVNTSHFRQTTPRVKAA